jgi:hypothetical protein
MNWTWELAHPLRDVEYIVEMAQTHFEHEVSSVLKTDPQVMRHHLTVALTNQLFDKHKEFIAVAKEDPYSILGYVWVDRGGWTTYSRDEISNAKFHHCQMDLPVRTRYKLIVQMIEQHILWCNMCKIPVICSTSIRGDSEGFMRIHKKMGFEVHGSYAWCRTEDAIKRIS